MRLGWYPLVFEGCYWYWWPKNWFLGMEPMDCGCFCVGLGPLHLQWGHPDGCYWFIDFEEYDEDA